MRLFQEMKAESLKLPYLKEKLGEWNLLLFFY